MKYGFLPFFFLMKLFLEQHPLKGISTNVNAFVRKEYCFKKKKTLF